MWHVVSKRINKTFSTIFGYLFGFRRSCQYGIIFTDRCNKTMMHKGVLRAVAAFLCLWSLGAGSARGQGSLGWPEWLPVANNGVSANAIYFFDATHAAIAQGANIYYLGSADPDGLKWDHSSMPPGIQFISQLRFIQGKLYAASLGTDVLVSIDSGKTWTNSGLGLPNANDVYADGSGVLRALHDPMRVFARLDTLHCIAQGNAQIFVSSDGGITWTSTGVPMVDSNSIGAVADRCKSVYVCPNSWGTIFRSTDIGQTWQTVITGSGPGSEYLNGASTVMYEGCEAGMYRSIDDGSTWRSVTTVQNFTAPLDVWGPMGEHVALWGTGGSWHCIWMTTMGGMDDLHSGTAMTDSNGMPLSQEDTLNLPLRLTSTCNAFFIPVPLEADVRGLTSKVTISGDRPGDFTLLDTQTYKLQDHLADDTAWIAYTPHDAVDTVTISIENNWNCSDWTDTRSAIVVAIPTLAIVPPPPIQGNCKPVGAAAFLKLDSCQTLVIDSIIIPQALASRFHCNATLPDTIRKGSGDSLFFTFDPRDTLADILDSVELFAHYPGMDSALAFWDFRQYLGNPDDTASLTDVNTFVSIELRALAKVTLLGSNVAFVVLDTIPVCERLDTFVVLQDTGCDSVQVNAISLSGSGFQILGNPGSIDLAPGQQDTIRLQADADTSGHPAQNNAALTITSDANPPLPPIALSRQIEYPASWELSLSSSQQATAGSKVTYKVLQSGQLPASATSLDFTITYNDDVLGFENNNDPAITYSRTPDGLGHLHFHFAPVPADSILDSVIFTAFLARDTQTSLLLEDIVLGNSQNVASDCLASITAIQSNFILLPQCGTPELGEFLRTGTIAIDKIDPNPAMSDATITVYSGENNSISGELSILDAIGRIVVEQNVTLSRGENRLMVNLEPLPSGFYTARFSTTEGARDRAFVKE